MQQREGKVADGRVGERGCFRGRGGEWREGVRWTDERGTGRERGRVRGTETEIKRQ